METRGLVLKSTGKWYLVKNPSGETVRCTIRGSVRLKGVRTTNPVAVGDIVWFEDDAQHNTGVIVRIEPRRNYIIRKSVNLSKETHIIAANIDQAVLVASLAQPVTPQEFIDRFLATAEAYRIPAYVVFNKTDLYGADEKSKLKRWTAIYQSAGYTCFATSILQPNSLAPIKQLITDKTTLFSGNSGVGKSTLLNTIDAALNLRTGEISEYHHAGVHTTTFAELFPLSFGGQVVDTPGLRGFGVVDMDKAEIYHFFPELFRTAAGCRFHNCMHINEPGCAVIDAVASEQIDSGRYRSYLSLYQGDDNRYRYD